MLTLASAVWTGFTCTYNLSGISFLTSVTRVSKAAVFMLRNMLIMLLESCSLHIFWRGRLCSWEGFFVAPQDSAAVNACQGLFSTQISCPPARRADILAPAACFIFQRSLWEWLRGFAAVYSRGEAASPAGVGMVGQLSRLVSLWPANCVMEGWSVNEHLSHSLFVSSSFYVSICFIFCLWCTSTLAWIS